MVDRLEELLALLEDEDGEEQEDAPALRTGGSVPASPIAGAGAENAAPEEREDGPAAAERDWTAEGEPLSEHGRDGRAEAAGQAEAGAGEDGPAEDGLEAPPWDGPVWSAARRNGTAETELPEISGGEALTLPEAARPGTAARAERAAERGLEELYRKTVQAGRPTAGKPPVEQAEGSARAEEPGRTAQLTVDELDRAVRRDSRRYDGGMSIF